MGRAQIVGGGADGRYSIEIDLGEAERDVIVARLTAQEADAEAKLVSAQLALTEKVGERDAAGAAYDAAVDAYIEMARGEAGALTEAQRQTITDAYEAARTDYSSALFAHAQALTQKNAIAFSLKALQRSLTQAQVLPLTDARPAWCADYTEDASGTVATIEVPGESNIVLIAPGGPAATSADGRLFARELMSPAQAFANAAILPGWQRHAPTYRTGVLTALDQDGDIASVALDEARSSAQRLDVNIQDTLTDIPVEYMTCNAAVFEVGDRVVVRFGAGNWDEATVVGFVTDPRPCCEGSITVTYMPGAVLDPYGIGFSIEIAGHATQHVECGECTAPVDYPRFAADTSQEYDVSSEWNPEVVTQQQLGVIACVGPNWGSNNVGIFCPQHVPGGGDVPMSVQPQYDTLPGCIVLMSWNPYSEGVWIVGLVYAELGPFGSFYSYGMPTPIFGDEEAPGGGGPPLDWFDGRTFTIDHIINSGGILRWARVEFTVDGEAAGLDYGGFPGGSYRRAVITNVVALGGVPPGPPTGEL